MTSVYFSFFSPKKVFCVYRLNASLGASLSRGLVHGDCTSIKRVFLNIEEWCPWSESCHLFILFTLIVLFSIARRDNRNTICVWRDLNRHLLALAEFGCFLSDLHDSKLRVRRETCRVVDMGAGGIECMMKKSLHTQCIPRWSAVSSKTPMCARACRCIAVSGTHRSSPHALVATLNPPHPHTTLIHAHRSGGVAHMRPGSSTRAEGAARMTTLHKQLVLSSAGPRRSRLCRPPRATTPFSILLTNFSMLGFLCPGGDANQILWMRISSKPDFKLPFSTTRLSSLPY